MLRTPEVGKQPAERQGGYQFFQSFLGKRIGVVDMGLLHRPIEHPERIGTVICHGPVKRVAAPHQLLLVQQAFDQDRPVFQKGLA
ncbi:hypothetical protein FQZ97_1251200 [compost metagenome]